MSLGTIKLPFLVFDRHTILDINLNLSHHSWTLAGRAYHHGEFNIQFDIK